MSKEIVMYVRRSYCGGVALARDVLGRYGVSFRELVVDDRLELAARLTEWTGFLSVPTLIVVNTGEDTPYTDFLPRPQEQPLRGFDRGPMITEPTNKELENWLFKHGFLDSPYKR
jgi:glutaredoxin